MVIAEFLRCDTEGLKEGGQLLFSFRVSRVFIRFPQCLCILVLVLKVFQGKFSTIWIITFLFIVGFNITIDLL